jgi:hypothetical protein
MLIHVAGAGAASPHRAASPSGTHAQHQEQT